MPVKASPVNEVVMLEGLMAQVLAHGPWPVTHGPWPMAHGPWAPWAGLGSNYQCTYIHIVVYKI